MAIRRFLPDVDKGLVRVLAVLLIVRFSKRPMICLVFFGLVEGSRSQVMGSFQRFQRLTASFVHAATMAGHRSKVQCAGQSRQGVVNESFMQ
jgi:hypothetical protein